MTQVQYDSQLHNRGDWKSVASYAGRYYGPEGDDLGDIPISIATFYDAETDAELGWIVAETPVECTEIHGTYADRDEAETAAGELAEELDETPDLDDVVEQIAATGYFDSPEIIPAVVAGMTSYSQGYLLITPDISEPVGTRWTTNGYLQCDHIQAPATFSSEPQASAWLLRAVSDLESED
jgi:hypothetical protein